MNGSGDISLRLKVRAFIGAARQKARELGGLKLAAYVSRRVFRTAVFRKDVLLIFVREEADLARPLCGSLDDHELREVDERTLRRCQAQQPAYFTPLRINAYEARLARRERCFGLFAGETLLNIGWIGLRSEIQAAEVGTQFSLTLPSLLPVIYDCWTPFEFRGRGYYPLALDRIADSLLRDYKQVWIYALATNVGSVKGIQKAGFRPFLKHVRRRFIFIERHMTTDFTRPRT